MDATPSITLDQMPQYLARQEQKQLVRIITCGSVDDGKSTLIGRLLLETGALYDDQFTALSSDSSRHGTTGGDIDPALLLDGLEDERQQGITIDVAYRYFQTASRTFIIADSPGHEQYTRNMVTAASNADLAVILVDATKGVLAQTRRHAFIATLIGVRSLVVTVNKMDLVDYSQAIYQQIREDCLQLAEKIGVRDVHCLPVSGLQADNVAAPSERMPWYDGATLLQTLQQAVPADINPATSFRFPVQRVCRPDAEFRGFSGTIASGTIRQGDRVMVLPARRASRIRSIIGLDGPQPGACVGQAVTLVLHDEIDISRGDMIVHADADDPPKVDHYCDAIVVWMSQNALTPGRSYWLKHTTRHTAAEVSEIAHRIDIASFQPVQASSLSNNDIACCRLALHDPIMFDPYERNRRTGAFILVDRITHETVGAGLIGNSFGPTASAMDWNLAPRSRQLSFTPSRISIQRRQQRHGHRAITVLLTGLSGSGKTTLAGELEQRLFATGHQVMSLDGQNLRFGISRDLGFSAEERSENLRRASEICRLINDAGMICIAAFVAPDQAVRRRVREQVGADRLLHVHLAAPVEVCRRRDQSGRYVAADRGEIVNFPGVTAPYPKPDDADLMIPTDQWTVEACVDAIESLIQPKLKLDEDDSSTGACHES